MQCNFADMLVSKQTWHGQTHDETCHHIAMIGLVLCTICHAIAVICSLAVCQNQVEAAYRRLITLSA